MRLRGRVLPAQGGLGQTWAPLLWLALVAALWLPEVPLDLQRADLGPSLHHPLGCDGLGRDGLLRLGVGAMRSLGFATATALLALLAGAALALGGRRWQPLGSVLRTLPPVLLILPVADRFHDLGWLPLAFVLGLLLAFHAEPPLRQRFRPLLEGCALPAARVLGAGWGDLVRTWLPWVGGQLRPLFPSLWLGALWAEVLIRYLGLGPGPDADSFGLLLNQELPRLVTDPTPLGWAALGGLLGLVAGVSQGRDTS
jgi:ABC-type dipeptide/oligopeptide/nickel transport system permease subunit